MLTQIGKFLGGIQPLKIVLIVSFIVSFVVFSPLLKFRNYDFWGSSGDHSYSVRPKDDLSLNVYKENEANGYFAPFLIANTFPHAFLLYALDLIGFSQFMATFIIVLLFFSFAVFFSFVSFSYFVRKYNFSDKFQYLNYFIFLSSILFVYTPYYSSLFYSGHFVISFMFILSPLLIMILDKILTEDTNLPLNLLCLFFLIAFISSSVANIAYVLLLLFVITLYVLSHLVYSRFGLRSMKFNALRINLVYIVLFSALSWWLLPNLVYMFEGFKEQSEYSSRTIGRALDYATKDSSILDILWYSSFSKTTYAVNFVIAGVRLLSLFLLIFILISRGIKANKILFFSIISVLFSVFILAALSDPFGIVFKYLYEKVPGFQIFRRPDSKVYWIFMLGYWLFFISMTLSYLSSLRKVVVLRSFLIFYTISTLAYSILFSSNIKIVPFDIPVAYYNAADYFEESSINRILVLPNQKGMPPEYDDSINNLLGYDFTTKVWGVDSLGYDLFGSLSLSKELSDELDRFLILLSSNNSICDFSNSLGIDAVVYKENLKSMHKYRLAGQEYSVLLNNHSELTSHVDYYEGDKKLFTVYNLKNVCNSTNTYPFIFENAENVLIDKRSSIFYEVTYMSTDTDTKVSLLRNKDSGWKAFTLNPLKEIEKIPSVGYLNVWNLDSTDSDIPQKIYIIYTHQVYMIIGSLITITCFIILVTSYLKQRKVINKDTRV